MKSTVKKVNGYFICETTFGKNNEFTYVSKFKSDLKGVAYQELKTAAIPKEELDLIKNLGCKNIETELAKLGYEVSAEQLLAERNKQLQKARKQDLKGETPQEKIQFHKDKIARLEAELAQAKLDFAQESQALMKEMDDQIKAVEAQKKLRDELKELAKGK